MIKGLKTLASVMKSLTNTVLDKKAAAREVAANLTAEQKEFLLSLRRSTDDE
jgi:hypothetical protein